MDAKSIREQTSQKIALMLDKAFDYLQKSWEKVGYSEEEQAILCDQVCDRLIDVISNIVAEAHSILHRFKERSLLENIEKN